MKILLLFLILFNLLALVQTQTPANNEASPMTVSSYKWSRARQTVETSHTEATNMPVRQVIPQNKTFARNARINDPRGARDPNQDTIDGRAEAIEKSVQESRTPKSYPSAPASVRFIAPLVMFQNPCPMSASSEMLLSELSLAL